MEQNEEDNIESNNMTAKSRSPVQAMKRYIESLPEEVSLREELTSYQFWKAVRTEFLASMLYVMFGCGTCLTYASVPPQKFANQSLTVNAIQSSDSLEQLVLELKVSLMFGLTSATLIQSMGHVSGCHITPAISVSLLVTRHISILRFVMYVFAQCFASIVACGILYGLLTTEERTQSGLGLTLPNSHLNASQAFGYEFLATFIVVLAYLVNCDPKRTDGGFKALSIGFAYTVAHLFAFRHTGASLSPARSLGPAVIINVWDKHWVYWVSPLIAGMISGFTYEYVRSTSSNECQTLKRSFRRRTSKGIKRDASSGLSNNETEFTLTSTECPRY